MDVEWNGLTMYAIGATSHTGSNWIESNRIEEDR